MEYKDYYAILGVKKKANEEAIKRAYRRLARQYHPDVNPGNKQFESTFRAINEAYEVLSDPRKRRKYDRLGANWYAGQHGEQASSNFDGSRWGSDGVKTGRIHVQYGDDDHLFLGGNFSDFLHSVFAGLGGPFAQEAQQRWPRRRQTEHSVDITLEEAFHGTQRLVALDGRRLEVKIPSGVRTGSRIRVVGEGHTHGAGDLLLVVKVKPHAVFQRDEHDLRCQLPVSLITAVLGGEVLVPTLTGQATLRIPAGTQSGQIFRLRGQGMPKLRQSESRGHLLVRVWVQVPTKLTPRARELFQELAALISEQSAEQ
jgi:curved DNA-binding protein